MIKHRFDYIKLFGYDAITFGKHVFITGGAYSNKQLLRHEAVHVKQYAREGFINFIIKYIYFHFKYGYEKNPLEIECNLIEEKNNVIRR